MRGDGSRTRSYAKGMVTLIFFVLAVQVAIFTIRSYENRKLLIATEKIISDTVRAESKVLRETIASVEREEKRFKSKPKVYVNYKKRDFKEIDQGEGRIDSNEKERESPREAYVPVNIKSISSKSKLELNSADSVDLVSLPGIGPFFASKIIDYRQKLRGFAFKEQLMEVYGIDQERFSIFGERVWVDTTLISKIKILEATQEELSSNPYIGSYAARAIIKFREIEEHSTVNLASLVANRIIKEELLKILKYYLE